MKKKILILSFLAIFTFVLCTACGSKTPALSASAEAKLSSSTENITLTDEQMSFLTDEKLLQGVRDYSVEVNTKLNSKELITGDKKIFSNIVVNDQKVDLTKEGSYMLSYIFTIDNEAYKKAVKEKKNAPVLSKTAKTVIASYTTKIQVLSKEEAEKKMAEGKEKEVITQANVNNVIADNQANGNGNTNANATASNSNASAGGNAAGAAENNNVSSDTKDKSANNKPSTPFQHSHNWVEQKKLVHHDPVTEQRWVEDSPAFDEPVYEYHTICDCGIFLDNMTNEQLYHHIEEDMMSGRGGGYKDEMVYMGTAHHEATGHYETVEVTAAWDEMVGSGTYICPACGATK